MTTHGVDATRRRLLAGAAAVTTVALAPGVMLIRPAEARPAGAPASPKARWGLLIDTNKDPKIWDICVTACREENGWAYDVGSYFGPGKIAGEFSVSMQTKNEVADQAIEAALEQIRRIREQPVSEQHLKDAKAYLTGSFPLRLDTSHKLVGMLSSIEFYGLGLDYVDRYPTLINAVTAADVQRVAQTYLDPERYALAVVADLTKAKIEP